TRALELATLGGARALGIHDRVGSLERGKAADLAAFPIDAVRPVFDPATAAVFASTRQARFVAVAGRVLVSDGSLVDEDSSLAARVQESADALSRWLSAEGATATPPPSLTR